MDRLAVISSESQRFADVLADVDPDRRCPTCPDWSASDLLWHLTTVHFFWAEILERRMVDESGLPDVERSKPQRPSATADMLALRQRATARLTEQLSMKADDDALWSWWPADQTVGFTRRMQTYEATMHRVDAELTAGVPVSPIAQDVAGGAVDHAVDVMWGWMPDSATYQPDCTVEFLATDTDQRWLVECGRWTAQDDEDGLLQGRTARRGTDTPRAAVKAPVVDLALWAWTRGGSVVTSGDPAAVAAITAVEREGIQ
ncbi:hypothetical protein CQY20_05615 [Mycolicibacterium agri]|uniref:Mycothiol-dependent maleylpyruvate isomerase metal-binding domain-containing protein n=1 Tax=Mycolicibacterium agri TaxID=36811 RepID=A0A2A7NAI8_MYCAG|nr:maleylpyruvate isomerase family mycothiol-dependent enzyme [Mycolicibacterium agri]PEG41132.1 hypothetical protein CQY20_05615 [Mycolicibacterium agri]GFG55436.1 hypothetical protein MAGR_68770 [Mycolicibacterium agri]